MFTTRFENSFTLLSVGCSGIVNVRDAVVIVSVHESGIVFELVDSNEVET